MGSDRDRPARADDHDAHRDLVAAHALDAVEPEDVRTVRAHLAVCRGCRRDLRRHHETVAVLASTAAALPPPSVWRGVARRTLPHRSPPPT